MSDVLIGKMKRILPHIAESGAMLMKYSMSISGSEPKEKNGQWILRPNNFVTIRIQPNNYCLQFVIRGYPEEFRISNGVQVKPKMGNGAYSECKLKKNSELLAIGYYIHTAYDNANRGRTRLRRQPHLSFEQWKAGHGLLLSSKPPRLD